MIQIAIRNITGADVAALKVLAEAFSGYWVFEVSNDEIALKVVVKSDLCDEFAEFEWFEGDPETEDPTGWELGDTSLAVPPIHKEFDMMATAATLESLVKQVCDWYAHSEREA